MIPSDSKVGPKQYTVTLECWKNFYTEIEVQAETEDEACRQISELRDEILENEATEWQEFGDGFSNENCVFLDRTKMKGYSPVWAEAKPQDQDE